MIGPGITIRGNVEGDEDLVVEGRIEGGIRLSKDLDVARDATVEATVSARTVRVAGRLVGDVDAADALSVESGAAVVGNVKTPSLVIADGAHFKGRVDMDFEIPGIEARSSGPSRRR